MTAPKEDILRKIEKLLNMADKSKGATDGEVENAMRLANKLMAEHNISMSEVKDKKDEPDIDVEEKMAAHIRYWSTWEKMLAIVMRHLCDVEPMVRYSINKQNPNATQKELKVCFIGDKHDTVIAAYMYEQLRKTIARGSRQYERWADRRSYAEGYVNQLIKRAAELKTQRDIGTGMVFVGKKAVMVKNYMDKIKVRTEKSGYKGERTGAYADGVRDGNRQDLGTKRRLA